MSSGDGNRRLVEAPVSRRPLLHPVIKSASLADDLCFEITVNGGTFRWLLTCSLFCPCPLEECWRKRSECIWEFHSTRECREKGPVTSSINTVLSGLQPSMDESKRRGSGLVLRSSRFKIIDSYFIFHMANTLSSVTDRGFCMNY